MTNEDFIESIRLHGEIWKEIPNYEGFYMASTNGRILSLGRYVRNKNSIFWKNPKLLTQTKVKSTGYLVVALSKENHQEYPLVHRLIASTFIPNPNNLLCIDHIDTNRANNRVSNLKWCNYVENMNNKSTRKKLRNTRKPRTKKGYCYPVIATKNGVVIKTYTSIQSVKEDGHDPKSVWLTCNGDRIQHHGFTWAYLS